MKKKAVLKEATKKVAATTKQLAHAKTAHAQAVDEQGANVASSRKAEVEYARAWGKADSLEKSHATAVKRKKETAAALKTMQGELEKAAEEKQAAEKAAEEATHTASEMVSKHKALVAHVHAIETKGLQVVKHKAKADAIADQALTKKEDAAKAKEEAAVKAIDAAKEHEAAGEAAKETLEAHHLAKDKSNYMTGIAYRQLQDTMNADAKGKATAKVAKELKGHADAVGEHCTDAGVEEEEEAPLPEGEAAPAAQAQAAPAAEAEAPL